MRWPSWTKVGIPESYEQVAFSGQATVAVTAFKEEVHMAKQPRVLTGLVAAVTGGARGIGRETARAFVAQGMTVAIGDLDLAAAQATAEELGPDVAAFELNVTDRASV